ncbi:MAG TPA: aminopeptidase [Longimicrobiales bacterium]|nr:aminopeptidase [Longimicrobiales bacterium]
MRQREGIPGRRPRRRLRLLAAFGALALAASCVACSAPMYVMKASIAEVRILRARRPIHQVLADSATPPATRGKLSYILEARRFAAEELGIDVGDAYTMYTHLERDTLALVVSAAPKDILAPVTWWFPIVGRVPYRGFFSVEDALEAAADLEAQGYDTYVRPTAAFSTLGWFNDPVLSTMLETDEVEVVVTVLHELSHRNLFVPGRVDFNESFATFAGRVAAIQFFCTREGSGPSSVKCLRAQARWRDYQRFSAFLDPFRAELERLYANPRLSYDEKVERREEIFAAALARFERDVMPTFESISFAGFLATPLNNATLLSRIRYYNRLADFEALLEEHGGDLGAAVAYLRERARGVDDPFSLLPQGEPPSPAD